MNTISDELLDTLWTTAARTPIKPEKTRKQRILFKWRRIITRAQKLAIQEAWDSGQTALIALGNNQFLMQSSSRPEVWHILDMEEKTCSCEAKGEFNSVERCRHLKRMLKLHAHVPPELIEYARQHLAQSKQGPVVNRSRKVISLADTLRGSAQHSFHAVG